MLLFNCVTILTMFDKLLCCKVFNSLSKQKLQQNKLCQDKSPVKEIECTSLQCFVIGRVLLCHLHTGVPVHLM